jgi:ribosomal protein L22
MTEKNYNPEQKERKSMKKQSRAEQAKTPLPKTQPKETEKKQGAGEEKQEVKKEGKEKKPEVKKPKKTEAVVNATNVPISTKQSMAICRFIKNKRIDKAISDLEQVLSMRRAVPMKGEIPHRKGKGMMSGRFPKNGSEAFIKLLKSLSSNATYNEVEEPVIVEAIANMGARPYGRFGQVRRKRTHVRLVARSKNKSKKTKESKK